MDEKEAYTQRLKAAVHFAVGKLCQHVSKDHERPISRQAIAVIAEVTFSQADLFAKDLEAFARHAKRQTVTMDDVKLLARRSTALYPHGATGGKGFALVNKVPRTDNEEPLSKSNHIQQKSEELALNNQERKKKNAAKRKSKSMEGTDAMETN